MVSVQKRQQRRVGLLLPSANIVMETDFYSNLPDKISLHTTRMFLQETTIEAEERMLDEFVFPAVNMIRHIKPDVVVFGCTSAGALRGKLYEDELMKKISGVVSAPVVSVMQSVEKELLLAGIKKLVIVTPYVQDVTQRIKHRFIEDGFDILNIKGMEISQSIELGQVTHQEIINFTQKAVRGFCPDAIFISCTNFPAMRIIPRLTQALGVPVFSSNQSTFNQVMEKINADDQ